MARNYFDATKAAGIPADFTKSKKAFTVKNPRFGSNPRFGPNPRSPKSPSTVSPFEVTVENPYGERPWPPDEEHKQDWPWDVPDVEEQDWPPSVNEYSKEKETMANKFLPFIVESSTPKNIFKTLMSRSKGMNDVLIASVFNLTLSVDIKKLRKIVKELPEMQLENIYEELLQKFPQYRVDEEVLFYFHNVIRYYPPSTPKYAPELSEFKLKDQATFFCVMSGIDDDECKKYTKINFGLIHNYKTILENFKEHVKFSDEGQTFSFSGSEDLKVFIMYHAVLRSQLEPETGTPKIKAEFIFSGGVKQ